MRSRALLLLVMPALGARASDGYIAAMEQLDRVCSAPAAEALAAYLAASRHEIPLVRCRAVRALAAHAGGSEVAADAVRQALFDVDPEVRRSAAPVASLLPDGREWIVESEQAVPGPGVTPPEPPPTLATGEWRACGRAAEAIARAGAPEAVALLETGWEHPSPFVAHKVAIGLSMLGDEGVEALVRGFASGEARRRSLCARELARRKGPVPVGLSVLDGALRSRDPFTVACALQIGQRSGADAGALAPLAATLLAEHPVVAREFLVAAGGAGAAELLRACERAAGGEQVLLLHALGRADLEGLDCMPLLTRLAQDADRQVAQAAVGAIAAVPTRDDEGVDAMLAELRANEKMLVSIAWRLRRKASPETLIRLLSHEDAVVRRAATLTAGDYPVALPGAIAPLTAVLGADADYVRVEAADALARHAGDAAISVLLAEIERRLARKDRQIHVDRAFARLGESAVPPLVRVLGAGTPGARAAAALALASVDAPRDAAIPGLVTALMGDEALLREPARRALHAIGEPAVPPLLAACEGGGDLRRALPVLSALADAAERLSRGRHSPALRAALAASLRTIAAIPVLERFATDPSDEVRAAAVRSLATWRHPALRHALSDPSARVRRVAAASFGRKAGDGDVEALAPLLADADSEVVSAAARALAGMGDGGRAALFAALCADPADPGARRALLAVMPSCGAEAVPLLMEELRHADNGVALAAAEALGKMGDLAAPAAPRMVALLDRKPEGVAKSALSEIAELGETCVPALLAAEGWTHLHKEAIVLIDLDAAPPLIAALADGGLRARALRALALLGPSAELAVPEVTALLADGDRETVSLAIEALRATGAAARPAAERLRELAKDPRWERPARAALAEIER